MLTGTRHIIERRKACTALAATHPTRIVDVKNNAVFAFVREADEGPLLALFNFSDTWQNISNDVIYRHGISLFEDVLSESTAATPQGQVQLPPFARVWLT